MIMDQDYLLRLSRCILLMLLFVYDFGLAIRKFISLILLLRMVFV